MNKRKLVPWLVCFASCALVFAAHAEDKKLTEGIEKDFLETVVSIEVLQEGGKGNLSEQASLSTIPQVKPCL